MKNIRGNSLEQIKCHVERHVALMRAETDPVDLSSEFSDIFREISASRPIESALDVVSENCRAEWNRAKLFDSDVWHIKSESAIKR